MQNSDLTIIAKTYDFILWAFNHTEKFPKSSRFSLSVKIEQKLLDMICLFEIAGRKSNKAALLAQADDILAELKILFRLSKDRKHLALNSYEYAARSMDEIGRLLGGWLKQQKPKPNN